MTKTPHSILLNTYFDLDDSTLLLTYHYKDLNDTAVLETELYHQLKVDTIDLNMDEIDAE